MVCPSWSSSDWPVNSQNTWDANIQKHERKKAAGKDFKQDLRKGIRISASENLIIQAQKEVLYLINGSSRFFFNYERIMLRYNFMPERIINLDEIRAKTVLPSLIILVQKKQR